MIETKRLAQAIQDHTDNQYDDESYDHDTHELTVYPHTCSASCAADIARRYNENPTV